MMPECIFQKLSEFDPKLAKFSQETIAGHVQRTDVGGDGMIEYVSCDACRVELIRSQKWVAEGGGKKQPIGRIVLSLSFVVANNPENLPPCIRNLMD